MEALSRVLRWSGIFVCVVCESVVIFPVLSLFLFVLFQAEEGYVHATVLAVLVGVWIGIVMHLSPVYTLVVILLMQHFVRWQTKEMSVHSRMGVAVFFGMCALVLSQEEGRTLALMTQHILIYIPLALIFRPLARQRQYAYTT